MRCFDGHSQLYSFPSLQFAMDLLRLCDKRLGIWNDTQFFGLKLLLRRAHLALGATPLAEL
jgi:hypothetical protein